MCVTLLSSHINLVVILIIILVVILVVILVDFCDKKVFGRGIGADLRQNA